MAQITRNSVSWDSVTRDSISVGLYHKTYYDRNLRFVPKY